MQIRQIDCAHEAGISATLAVELADMVSPRGEWVCSPKDNNDPTLDAAAAAEAAGSAAEPAAPRGGLVAVLEDRFPRDSSGLCGWLKVD